MRCAFHATGREEQSHHAKPRTFMKTNQHAMPSSMSSKVLKARCYSHMPAMPFLLLREVAAAEKIKRGWAGAVEEEREDRKVEEGGRT